MYIKVAFPLPVRKLFFYRVPDRFRNSVKVGSMVLAPFHNRVITGYVVEVCKRPEIDIIKDINDVCFDDVMFSEEMLKLCYWISEYYFVPLGEVIQTVLPKGLNRFSYLKVRLKKENLQEVIKGIGSFSSIEEKIVSLLQKRKSISLKNLQNRFKSKYFFMSINNLQKMGFIEIENAISKPKVSALFEDFVKLENKKPVDFDLIFGKRRAPVQKKVLKYLLNSGKELISKSAIIERFGNVENSLKGLVEKGVIKIVKKEKIRQYEFDYYDDFQKPSKLNTYQEKAFELLSRAINRNVFKVFLIYGVTGSGKTQVYIEAINKVLINGSSVIYLVPEIALTPQTTYRLKEYFGENVELIHSGMSQGERFDAWRRIKNGEKKLVVGPRSAVFAPLKNIALIIVDEEHDESYKQQESPRYNARDVAIMRGKLNNAVVVLGSATPSIESFYNARNGKYELITLPERIDNIQLPEVKIIDMKKEWKKKKNVVFSDYLIKRMKEQLDAGEQVLLLQNRRGFSTFLHCKDCGYIEECKNCSVTLTYHKRDNILLCHYCGYRKNPPTQCPECKGNNMVFSGTGTQRVQTEIKKFFPEIELKRLDLDTAYLKGASEKITGGFLRKEYQVLVGTKMISKGFDFSGVNFGGVVNADIGLLIPDFRASERTFQLLTQFAGRTGRRDIRGEVVIQTYEPNHFCLQSVKKHNFEEFYNFELDNRKELDYPPFGRLILLRFSCKSEIKVMDVSEKIGEFIRKKYGEKIVLGPVPAPIQKISKLYRWNIIIKVNKREDETGSIIRKITEDVRNFYEGKFRKNGVSMAIDVDPYNLL